MGQGSERRIGGRRPGNRLSNWQENVEDISVGLIGRDEGNVSPSSHAEQVRKLDSFVNKNNS